MKILSIKLSNLASLSGEQCIDFNKEPLKSAGLIAITGRTGAGKSTILDALCLALYGEIPRLQYSTDAKIYDNSGKNKISITDARQILQRGTGQGFAEVDFIGLDNKKYRSGWKVRRAYNRANNDLVKVECFIQHIDDGKILTQNKTEHKNIIPQLIGLTFSQFTRAVLLAQFEVGAFLKANDNERAHLLEYLTDSRIFTIISQLAYQKNKHYEDEYKLQQQRLKQFEYLNDEEREQLNQQHQQLQHQQQNLQQQLQNLREQQHIQQKYQQFCVELEQIEQQYQNCIAQTDEITQYQKQIQHYQYVVEIRGQVLQQQKLQKMIQNQQETVQQKQQEYQVKKQQSQNIEENYQTARQNWQIQQHQQQQAFSHIEQGLVLEQQCDYLREQYQQQRVKIRENEQNINNIQQKIDELFSKQQQTQQLIQQSQQALHFTSDLSIFDDNYLFYVEQLRTWQNLHQQYMEELSCLSVPDDVGVSVYYQQIKQQLYDLKDKYGSIDTFANRLQQQLQDYHQMQQHSMMTTQFVEKLSVYQQVQEKLKNEQKQAHSLKHRCQIAQKNLLQTQQDYDIAEQKLTDIVQILQQQRLLHSQNVEQLRKQLKENQPCMVCGSVEHPFVHHQEILAQQLNNLHQQQEQDARRNRDDALHSWQRQQQALTVLQIKYQQVKENIKELEQNLHSDRIEIEHYWCNIELRISIEWQDWQQHIENILQALQSYLKNIEQEQERQYQFYQKDNEQLKHYRQIKHNCEQWQSVAQLQQHYQQIEEKIIILCSAKRQQLWQQQPNQQAELMLQELEQRHRVQQQLSKYQEDEKYFSYELKHYNSQKMVVEQLINNLNIEQKQREEQGIALKNQVRQIIQTFAPNDCQVNTVKAWKDEIHDRVMLAQKISEQYQQEKQEIEQQLQQDEIILVQQRTQLEQNQQQLQQCNDEIQDWLAQHSTFSFDDVLTLSKLDITTHRIELEEKINNYQQQKNRLAGQLDGLQQQKQSYQDVEKISIDELQQQIQQQLYLVEQIQQKERTVYVQLEHDRKQREQYQKLDRELQDFMQNYYRWNKIHKVIGSQSGEKFQRIAQQYYLDILLDYANVQLQQLLPRYELQRIQNSLGLAVKDREMNDELRTVLSLSGGESFLVSLALALAIAQLASGSIKLDSLFIDEGFGTLDQQSLHLVMDSLDRLQSQGRKVIVISHIVEIHERIPVQIQVQQQGAGKSVLKVVG